MSYSELREMIESAINMNGDEIRQCRHITDDLRRFNILIRSKTDYMEIRDELAAAFKLVEINASDITYYKKTPYADGYYTINHGPGTERRIVREPELVSLINVEEPVLTYTDDSKAEINQAFRSLFKEDNALVVFSNIEGIDNACNRDYLLRFIREDRDLSPKPVILVLDGADGRFLSIIRNEGKDAFFEYHSKE